MKFRSKPVEIEANQFTHGATAPIGVRTREDGSSYVVTIQGEEVTVHPEDWIILEDPPGDGTRAYPCKPDVFDRRYQLAPTERRLAELLNNPDCEWRTGSSSRQERAVETPPMTYSKSDLELAKKISKHAYSRTAGCNLAFTPIAEIIAQHRATNGERDSDTVGLNELAMKWERLHDARTRQLATIEEQRESLLGFCRVVLPEHPKGTAVWDRDIALMYLELRHKDTNTLIDALDEALSFCPIGIKERLRSVIENRQSVQHPSRLLEALRAIRDPEHCLTAFTVQGLRDIAAAAMQEVDPKNDYSSCTGPDERALEGFDGDEPQREQLEGWDCSAGFAPNQGQP